MPAAGSAGGDRRTGSQKAAQMQQNAAGRQHTSRGSRPIHRRGSDDKDDTVWPKEAGEWVDKVFIALEATFGQPRGEAIEKRKALKELAANTSSPKRGSAATPGQGRQDRAQSQKSPWKSRRGAETTAAVISSPRGKKRKANGLLHGGSHEERVVSPVLLHQSTTQAMPPAEDNYAAIDLSSTEEDTDEATPTRPRAAEHEIRASQDSAVPSQSHSFSSLINFNPHGSSQRGSSPAECAECDIPAQFSAVTSRLDELRLRLRLGMYKVTTNQTGIPLHALTVPDDPPPSDLPTCKRAKPSANEQQQMPRDGSSVRASTRTALPTVTVTSADAVDSPSTIKTYPRLSAAPILRPTAFSAQSITQSASAEADSSVTEHEASPSDARSTFAAAVASADAAVDMEMRRRRQNGSATGRAAESGPETTNVDPIHP